MSESKGARLSCPRCGAFGYVESRNVNGRTYYYFVHVWREEGRRRVKKCYLGPREYRYVERLNPLGLAGLVDRERFTRYLQNLLSQLTPDQIKWLKAEVSRWGGDEAEA